MKYLKYFENVADIFKTEKLYQKIEDIATLLAEDKIKEIDIPKDGFERACKIFRGYIAEDIECWLKRYTPGKSTHIHFYKYKQPGQKKNFHYWVYFLEDEYFLFVRKGSGKYRDSNSRFDTYWIVDGWDGLEQVFQRFDPF